MHDTGSYDQAARLRYMVRQSSSRGEPRSRTVAITSGKGGVGKSTVALNLAGWLGYEGLSVLLVDADANLGNLDVMLGMTPVRRVGDVLRGACPIEEVLVPAMRNVTLLPGSSGDPLHPPLRGDDQQAFLATLREAGERFDLVLIDTAAGLTPENVGYALAADETIVVSNARPTAIMDSYAVIKQFLLAGAGGVTILMNGVHDLREAGEAADKLQIAVRHFLHVDVGYLGAIPFDPHAADAETRQDALMRIHPSSRASRGVRKLAERFLVRTDDRRVNREGASA